MDDLEKLFAAYREAIPDPEPSVGFTPGVWSKIEARRPPVRFLRRMAEAFVTIAAVVTILFGAVLIPRMQKAPVYSATYVDVLAAEHYSENVALNEILRADPGAEGRTR